MDLQKTLLILQIACFIINLLLSGAALQKYLQKKNSISLNLFLAFSNTTIALVFQIILTGGFLNDLNSQSAFMTFMNSYLLPYIFLATGLFFLLQFSFEVFYKGEESLLLTKIALIFLIALITWALIDYRTVYDDDIVDFLLSVDFHTILYAMLIVPSIIFNGARLKKRIKGEAEYPRIRDITLMGVFMFITVIFLVAETVVGIVSGEYINVFSFLSWPFAAVGLYIAYRGLYKK